MRRSVCAPVIALALVFLSLPASDPAQAGPKSFHEDFTSTQYRDDFNTTADWDTVAAVLRAPDFTPVAQASYATAGSAGGVCTDGNRTFVADGAGGLLVLSWSHWSTSFQVVGSCSTSDKAEAVFVAGDYAYVAVGNGGLDVVDISDPSNPTVAANYDTTGTVSDVIVAGSQAFLATYGVGLQVLDVSDPLHPVHLGLFTSAARARGLDLHGNLVFVAAEGYGLYIVDVSNPVTPVQVGYYDTVGEAMDVAVSGNVAYVADGSEGLLVLDVSDVTAPSLLDTQATGDYARGVDVAGARVMVASGTAGVVQFDMTDPANGIRIGVVASTGASLDVVLAADRALVADDDDVHLVRVANLVEPLTVGQLSLTGQINDIAVSGRHAFLANETQGLQIVSLADPHNPVLIGSLVLPGNARGVKVAGDYAYVAAGTAGLMAVDITDVTSPVLADSVDTPGTAKNVFVDGPYVYVADGIWGLRIIDAADPTDLGFVSLYGPVAEVHDVFVSGGLAYLGLASSPYFEVVDVSSPGTPTHVGQLGSSLACGATSVFIARDLAYLADPCEYFTMVNVSDPSNPGFPTPAFDIPGPVDVVGEGAYVHVAQGGYGYKLLDYGGSVAASSGYTVPYLGSVAPFGNYALGGGSTGEFVVLQVFQNEFDLEFNRNDRGRSLSVANESDDIIRVRLSTVQSDSVTWRLSTKDVGGWFSVDPGAGWYELSSLQTGTGMQWRSLHEWGGPGVNPSVSELTIEWLQDYAYIDAVTDVANDQGRQVSLSWTRSGHDFVGDASQIVEYAVYRRIDPGLAKSAPRPDLSALSAPAREHAETAATAGWHYLVTVPVRVEDHYAVVVPSLVDSTVADGMAYSTYMVSALTGTLGVYYDSPPDSGYSLDNLAPAPPEGLMFGGGTLTWNDPLDADFDYFTVYGSDLETWDGTAVLIGATSGTTADVNAHPYAYYHVTATDFSGNEGQAASTLGQVTGIGDPGAPRYLLRANAPNPFASSTEIAFSLAEDTFVELSVYDLSGRLVRRLVSGTLPPGAHEASWDGRDAMGRSVAAGIYLYRLHTPAFQQTRRMVVLR